MQPKSFLWSRLMLVFATNLASKIEKGKKGFVPKQDVFEKLAVLFVFFFMNLWKFFFMKFLLFVHSSL